MGRYFVIILLVLNYFIYANGIVDVDYSCALKWVPEGYGNVPLYAVVPSPGEFIARLNLNRDNEWRIGRLIPEEGLAWFVFVVENQAHVTLTSETYEVLTNPDNCILEWIPTVGGQIPKYVIPSDEKEHVDFVGRGIVAGFAMVGGVYPSESALLVAYEGKVYPRRHYDILTSRYPFLSLELRDFTFPILDYRVLEKNTKEMLIGQMQVVSELGKGGSPSPTVVHPIEHSKQIKEVFRWEEKQKWEGVANLTIDMDLWVGAPTVAVQFTNIHEENKPDDGRPPKLVHERIHPIVMDRTITISGNGGVGSTSYGNYQVCSAATVLQNFAVKFEALAIVNAPNMRADQIKEILRRTGRNILGDGVEDEDFVIVRIYGFLRGTFVTGTSSYFSPVDSEGACVSVLKNSKHTISYHHFQTS